MPIINQPYTFPGRFKKLIQTIRFTNSTLVPNYIAPFDTLDVEHIVTFPEGYTLEVSIAYSINILSSGDSEKADSLEISLPYVTTIFPMTK